MVGQYLVKKEIIGLDLIRFVCAFIVVVCHLIETVYPIFWFPEGSVAVDVFFVISGFIIPRSSEGRTPFQFFKSRLIRLGPALWICSTIAFIAGIIAYGLSEDLTGKYLRTIFFVPFTLHRDHELGDLWMDLPYWTLFVEAGFYCIIFAMLCKNAFNKIAWLADILGTVSFIYWAVLLMFKLLFPESHIGQIIVDTAFKRYLDVLMVHFGCWFGVGINIWLLSRQKSIYRWLSLVICLVGGLMEEANHDLFYDRSVLLCFAYCILGIAAIWWAVFSNTQYTDKAKAFCRRIGLATYPVYLIHNYTGTIIIVWLVGLGANRVGAALGISALMIAAGFAVSIWLEPRLQNRLKNIL